MDEFVMRNWIGV